MCTEATKITPFGKDQNLFREKTQFHYSKSLSEISTNANHKRFFKRGN